MVQGSDLPGAAPDEDVPALIAPDARVTAYDIEIISGDPDTVTTDLGDANGIEVFNSGGHFDEAGKTIASDELVGYIGDLIGEDLSELQGENNFLSLNFTAFAYNYGTWDFEGDDNFLTPGFVDGIQLGLDTVAATTTGGVFAPSGSAFVAQNSTNGSTGLFNYGTMIGQGNSYDAVIDIETTHDADGSGALGGILGPSTEIPNFVFIYNAGYQEHLGPPSNEPVLSVEGPESPETFATYGVIGSEATPYDWQFSAEEAFEGKFGMMAGGGVDWDFVDNLLEGAADGDSELGRFTDAANDQLITTNGDGAGVLAFNQGLLIGQMDLRADNESLALVINDGSWFTRGTSNFYGSETDILLNTGLVQAAFRGDLAAETEFNSLNFTANFGVISLMDGAFEVDEIDDEVVSVEGDRLIIDGDYFGGSGFDDEGLTMMSELPLIEEMSLEGEGDEPTAKLGGKGYFALDAFLASDDSGFGEADEFEITGQISGATQLIVRVDPLSDEFWGINQEGIDVVLYDNPGSIAGDCGEDEICEEGDLFSISSFSPDYTTIGDIPVLERGMFATYLVNDSSDEDFELRTTWGTGALGAPAIISGAAAINRQGLDVVSDHIYAGQFSGAGGAGADLPVDAPVYEAPAASSTSYSTGIWVKGTGEWSERDTTLTESFAGLDVDTSIDQDIYSLLAGADMKLSPDSPYRFGIFGGYSTSSLDFDTSSSTASVDYEGGSLGAYAAYNNGAFYVDATVKADWLATDYSFADIETDADVFNIGLAANTGYRMNFGPGFFEPIASVVYVHSDVDDFSAGGGSVDFSSGESLRGGVGARVGTSFGVGGGATTELSVLGKVWNEFGDDNEVTVTDGVDTATFTDEMSGLFGELSATAVVTSADGSLSGFLSGGGEFSDDSTALNAKVGVRKAF